MTERPEYVGWVRSNGCGEIVFRQAAHPAKETDLPAQGWHKVVLRDEVDRLLTEVRDWKATAKGARREFVAAQEAHDGAEAALDRVRALLDAYPHSQSLLSVSRVREAIAGPGSVTERPTPDDIIATHQGHDHTDDGRTFTYRCIDCNDDWPCTPYLHARATLARTASPQPRRRMT